MLSWKERRERYACFLHPTFEPLYMALFANLDLSWGPTCGFRSGKEQQELYEQGRERPGKIVTNAKPYHSPHNYGCAVDLCLFDGDGRPMWPTTDEEWRPIGVVCKTLKLSWGGNFKNYVDRPHVELAINHTWDEVHNIYITAGIGAAKDFIARSREEWLHKVNNA